MKQKQIKNRLLILIAMNCLTFLLFAVGCSKKEKKPPVALSGNSASQMSSISNPKPVQNQASSVSKLNFSTTNQLDFSTKKDPFKAFIVIKKGALQTNKSLRSSSKFALPIHNYDINQFKLIGVITGGKDNQAMVTDPNGKAYVLKIGMTIGKNDGIINLITTNGVDVIEQYRDESGKLRKQHILIGMQRKQ